MNAFSLRAAVLAVSMGWTACGAPAPPPTPLPDPAICRALVHAEPKAWAAALPPVQGLGAGAAPLLVDELRAQPTAPGAQAAVAALGRLGNPAAEPFLLELLHDRGDLALEAAQALGTLPAAAATNALLDTMRDRLADATLRTACAASLLRLGQTAAVREFIVAVLLAGTPDGQQGAQRFGLPNKSRWAHERHLLIRALQAVAGQDFGLDTDAPWPALSAATARVDAWLRAR
ncbi:MAG: hypothetical protein IPK26_05800 [Planctomycetes bacterium]|nr:hypothetical protein [Planctomycetota bacterium]